jgi:hypothetical protein
VLQCGWCNRPCNITNPVTLTITQCVTQQLTEMSLCDYFSIWSYE